jgi:excisionase family DNA binding protein
MVCEPLIDAEAAGRILGVSGKMAKRMADRGEIPALRIGNRWRFRASALDKFIEDRLALRRQPCPERSNKLQ